MVLSIHLYTVAKGIPSNNTAGCSEILLGTYRMDDGTVQETKIVPFTISLFLLALNKLL